MSISVNSMQGFIELNESEQLELEGGFWAAVGIGIVGTLLYNVADEAVKQSTGKSIATHIVDAIETYPHSQMNYRVL